MSNDDSKELNNYAYWDTIFMILGTIALSQHLKIMLLVYACFSILRAWDGKHYLTEDIFRIGSYLAMPIALPKGNDITGENQNLTIHL